MAKMICVKCEVPFKIEKNGIIVPEMFMKNTKIYKIFRADKWRCPVCGMEVVTGFGDCFAEHFNEDCNKIVEKMKEHGAVVVYSKEVRG